MITVGLSAYVAFHFDDILIKLKSFLQRLSGPPGMTMDWQGAPASPSSYTVKRILRLEIPVDTYPNVISISCFMFWCYHFSLLVTNRIF